MSGSDVLSKYLTADTTAAAGSLSFRNTGAAGTVILQLGTVADATVVSDTTLPEMGVLFTPGGYLAYTAGTPVFTSATAFYA